MTDTSYQRRSVVVTFALKAGKTFTDTKSDTLTITNARCHASTDAYLGGSTELDLSIWGLPKTYLAQLGCFGIIISEADKYMVKVTVGDDTFFSGVVTTAYADFSQIPDVPLVLKAIPGAFEITGSTAGFSQSGAQEAAGIIETICSNIGYAFTNNGVTAVLTNPHYVSDAVSNMRAVAKDAGFFIDIANDAVTIWPKGDARDEATLYTSPGNGLLGYPAWAVCGLSLTTLYAPDARAGRDIQVETDLPGASGTYNITGVRHIISSKVPGGQWQSLIQCYKRS